MVNTKCLICLRPHQNLMPLNQVNGEDLRKRIELCAGIKLLNHPNCPDKMCLACYKALNIAFRFRSNCQISQEKLKKNLMKNKIKELQGKQTPLDELPAAALQKAATNYKHRILPNNVLSNENYKGMEQKQEAIGICDETVGASCKPMRNTCHVPNQLEFQEEYYKLVDYDNNFNECDDEVQSEHCSKDEAVTDDDDEGQFLDNSCTLSWDNFAVGSTTDECLMDSTEGELNYLADESADDEQNEKKEESDDEQNEKQEEPHDEQNEKQEEPDDEQNEKQEEPHDEQNEKQEEEHVMTRATNESSTKQLRMPINVVKPTKSNDDELPHFRLDTLENMTELEFENICHMRKNTFCKILDQLNAIAEQQNTDKFELKMDRQLLATLMYLCHAKVNLKNVAKRFDISHTSALRIVRSTCACLVELNSRCGLISWPQTTPEFHNFLGAIGVLGVHNFGLPLNKKLSNDFLNANGLAEVAMQAICNEQHKFLNCYVGAGGQLPESSIWRQSRMYSALCALNIKIAPEQHLLANAAYPLTTYIMVPYASETLTSAQHKFNLRHEQACKVFAETMQILTKRFARLSALEMRRLETAIDAIMACCILHNLCLDNEDAYVQNSEVTEADSMSMRTPVIAKESVKCTQNGFRKRQQLTSIF